MHRRRWTLWVSLAGAAVLLAGGGAWSWSALHHRHDESRLLEGPVRRLALEVDRGTVEVVGGDGPLVRVDYTRRSVGASAPAVTQWLDGGLLRIVGVCPGGVVLDCRTDFRIELPAATQLDARVGSGSLSISGIRGTLKVRTTSAAVNLSGVEGSINAMTGSGAVAGDDLRTSHLEVASLKGDVGVGLSQVTGSVSIVSDSGAVNLAVPGGPYRVEAASAIGIVDVSVCQALDASVLIQVESTLGDVAVRPSAPDEGATDEGAACP